MSERGRPRSFDRAAALRRAMVVFWAKDYDGASLSDLTRAMGINPPSLYAAFGSKEALFREAVALYGATEGTEIWRALLEGPTAREAFERFLRLSAAAFTRARRPPGCLIVLSGLHATAANSPVCRELREQRQANVTALKDRLRRSVEEGELPKGLNCQAVARFYATVQHGMSIQARDGVSRGALLAVARGAMAAWDGVVSHAERPRRTRPAGSRAGSTPRARRGRAGVS